MSPELTTDFFPEETAQCDAPTIFSHAEVQHALLWKYGRLATYVFIESVWELIDEYRAHFAPKSVEAKP